MLHSLRLPQTNEAMPSRRGKFRYQLVWIPALIFFQTRLGQLQKAAEPCEEAFIKEATFSLAALDAHRVVATEAAMRVNAFPTADVSCDVSSGSMRIVRSTHVSKICWYANDYLRILRRVQKSKRMQDFIVCDRDCTQADTHVFSLAKSRQIVDTRNRTVSVLPVNVGRHFKWVPYALHDRWTFDSKLPVAL